MNVDVSPNNISCFLICLLAAKFDFIIQCVILDIKLTLDGFSVIFRQKEFSLKKKIYSKLMFVLKFISSVTISKILGKINDL